MSASTAAIPVQPALNLVSTHLRLRPDCSVEKLAVDASFWPRLIQGELGDFHHEYLVTTSTFTSDWNQWEVHPNGDEIVIMIDGAVDFIVETPAGEQCTSVRQPGEFVFVPRGCWHTAKVNRPSTMIFITAGEGTRTRPRSA